MTIKRAKNSIKSYYKKYGLNKSFRAVYHFAYQKMRKYQIDVLKQREVSVHGTKMITMENDPLGTSAELAIFSSHEPITTKLISKYLRKNSVCLDIGGNIGYYALLEKKIIGKNGRIIVIEPSPENFKILKKNLKLEDNSTDLALNIAAGDKDGSIKFLLYKNAGNSSMIVPEGMESKYPGQTIDVPIKKIDTIVDELKLEKLDFVRMDSEGYEYNILQGMKETLKKFRPIIQLEFHKGIMGESKTRNFFEIMKELKYDSKYFIPRDLDVPFIGTEKDITEYSVDELLKQLDNKSIRTLFMLTLIPIEKTKDFTYRITNPS